MGVSERLDPGEARLFSEQERLDSALFAAGGGRVALHSSRCPGREAANEDSAAVVAVGERSAVLAVADGFGGAPAGEHASAVAVRALADAIRSASRAGRDVRVGIMDGFEQANRAVLALGVGSATTLTVVEVAGGAVRPYHAGDSVVLLTGQRGRIKLQTISHSPVGYGVASGLLDAEAALHHDERHVVSNAVGSADMHIDVGPSWPLAPRDTLVVASDGLSDNLRAAEIADCVRRGPLAAAARELSSRARSRMTDGGADVPSKPDDLTFMIFRPG